MFFELDLGLVIVVVLAPSFFFIVGFHRRVASSFSIVVFHSRVASSMSIVVVDRLCACTNFTDRISSACTNFTDGVS